MASRISIRLYSQRYNTHIVLMTFDSDLGISGSGPTKRIPYYNIIWAGVEDNTLTIHHVSDPTKPSIKLDRLSFSVGDPENAASAEQFAIELRSRAYGNAKQQKRALVLVNPNSGPGGAIRRWQKEAKPLFEAAKMELEVLILTNGGHAMTLVEKMDIEKYDTVIACSGDGTPHEIFNGLAKRPDAKRALSKIAVGHIPCGSGNAMALNLYGSNKPATAAIGIIKGVETPLDLVSITQGSKRYVSFLSQALGIIAESDLGTENFRWMGSKRFEMGMLMRVYQKKCYPCDLAVKVEVAEKNDVKAYYRRHAKNDSKPISTNGQSGRNEGEPESEGLPVLKYGTINDDISGLEGWETLNSDKIGNFYCGNMAYMSPDANFFPAALPSDGCMDLFTMDGNVRSTRATKTLLAIESGKFFDMPEVKYRKISAYRITPRDQKDGYISIDGEKVPFQPFQAEIHQGLGRVLSKRGKFEAKGPLGWESAPITEGGGDQQKSAEGQAATGEEAVNDAPAPNCLDSQN